MNEFISFENRFDRLYGNIIPDGKEYICHQGFFKDMNRDYLQLAKLMKSYRNILALVNATLLNKKDTNKTKIRLALITMKDVIKETE